MTTIDYSAQAALYLGRDWQTALDHGARTFSSAAKAIRFALEEAAPVSLHGALMIVDGQTYSPQEIRTFYRNAEFPFSRKSERLAATSEPLEDWAPTARNLN